MDPKRKSIFSLPASSQEKRIKTHHQYDASNRYFAKNSPVEPNGIRSRLALLKRLVGEIMDSPQSVQDHATECGPAVVKAAAELNSAFRLAGNSSTSFASPYTSLGASGTLEGPPGLPVLPYITDDTLQKAVFTHPGLNDNNQATYDRLEILGDAYIELIATKLVWGQFREIPSGRISQIRELLVKNETLSDFATQYGLDSRASVPPGYVDQPKRWIKTKGDIFEAYVAAVILSHPDGGFKMVEDWLTQLWLPKISGLGAEQTKLQSKEALAKKVMGKGVKLVYIDERPPVSLKGGLQNFFIGVYLTGWRWDKRHLGSGQGSNKAIAGNEAARQALLNKPLIDEIVMFKKASELKNMQP